MILALYTFRFTFSHAHIETSRAARARQLQGACAHRCISSLADGRRHRAPFTRANLDKFVEQNLVVFVDGQVAFILQEVLRLLSLLPTLLQHFAYVARGLDLLSLARVNSLDLALVDHELPTIQFRG